MTLGGNFWVSSLGVDRVGRPTRPPRVVGWSTRVDPHPGRRPPRMGRPIRVVRTVGVHPRRDLSRRVERWATRLGRPRGAARTARLGGVHLRAHRYVGLSRVGVRGVLRGGYPRTPTPQTPRWGAGGTTPSHPVHPVNLHVGLRPHPPGWGGGAVAPTAHSTPPPSSPLGTKPSLSHVSMIQESASLLLKLNSAISLEVTSKAF